MSVVIPICVLQWQVLILFPSQLLVPVGPIWIKSDKVFRREFCNRVIAALNNHFKEIWFVEWRWTVFVMGNSFMTMPVLNEMLQRNSSVCFLGEFPWPRRKLSDLALCLLHSLINDVFELIPLRFTECTICQEISIRFPNFVGIEFIIRTVII